jgi:hypothetical protein
MYDDDKMHADFLMSRLVSHVVSHLFFGFVQVPRLSQPMRLFHDIMSTPGAALPAQTRGC